MFGMNENEAVAMVGRTETRVPEAIDALLHGEPERKKAVFAINTHTLFLVLRELEHRKVRIPDDLGVCGYDALAGQSWFIREFPQFTSRCVKWAFRQGKRSLRHCKWNDESGD